MHTNTLFSAYFETFFKSFFRKQLFMQQNEADDIFFSYSYLNKLVEYI